MGRPFLQGELPVAFANSNEIYPSKLPDGSVYHGTVFLKPAISHPRFMVGEYTYASSFDPPKDWAARLAPYLFDFSPEQLVIGKFCQIADGVQIITASANHRYDGFSSYPFAIFDDGPNEGRASMPKPGRDTSIGHDVWIGQNAKIMPGATLGNGVIVGAGAVVSGRIPDYAIVSGNPGRIHRMRFEPDMIDVLDEISWWNWDIEQILKHEAAICNADRKALLAAYDEVRDR